MSIHDTLSSPLDFRPISRTYTPAMNIPSTSSTKSMTSSSLSPQNILPDVFDNSAESFIAVEDIYAPSMHFHPTSTSKWIDNSEKIHVLSNVQIMGETSTSDKEN